MERPPRNNQSFRGNNRGGYRGRGGNFRGRGGGRGRGGFHFVSPFQGQDVDYSPEAIEQRFAPFYSSVMTQDPWAHLEQTYNKQES